MLFEGFLVILKIHFEFPNERFESLDSFPLRFRQEEVVYSPSKQEQTCPDGPPPHKGDQRRTNHIGCDVFLMGLDPFGQFGKDVIF